MDPVTKVVSPVMVSPRSRDKQCEYITDQASCDLNSRCVWENQKCYSKLFKKLNLPKFS
jgi:hypothetical protein